jgi:hypothetical protein
MTTRRRAPATATATPVDAKMPAMPSWWLGDEDASESSLSATRQM